MPCAAKPIADEYSVFYTIKDVVPSTIDARFFSAFESRMGFEPILSGFAFC